MSVTYGLSRVASRPSWMRRAVPVLRQAGVADLLEGEGGALGVGLRRSGAGALPVAVAVLDGVAVGVADRMPVRVRENRRETGFDGMPAQPLPEGGDRVVRQVQQRARTSAYTSRSPPQLTANRRKIRTRWRRFPPRDRPCSSWPT